MNLLTKTLAVVFLLQSGLLLAGNNVADIANYRMYSPTFSSSGQPTAEQLKSVAEAGFKRVIYLAFSDNHTAIETEDRVVKSLDMDYAHIPVDFDKPTLQDFEDFAAILNRNILEPTLLHCQINLRASTFSFLYRVIYGGVPMATAKQDLDAIWVPDEVWYTFIVDVLQQHGLSHQCADCDWAENELG